MFTLLSRIFGVLCLSSIVIVLTTLFLGARNLPAILASVRQLVRDAFRGSYRLYNAILSLLQSWIGYDLFQPVIRTICTVILSLMIGTGLLGIFSLNIPVWVLIILILHGLFVGLAWENILRSEGFQTGVNLE